LLNGRLKRSILGAGSIVFVLATTALPASAQGTTVEDALAFVNEGLEACIRDQVPNTSVLVGSVTALDCGSVDYGIVTLLGIQQFTGLTSLNVSSQALGASPSLGSVAQLASLEVLNLSGNEIDDISDLSALVGLQELRVVGNALSGDLASVLQPMVGLRILDLQGNELTSVGAGAGVGVAALANLEELYISDNQIAVLPSLNDLDNLTTLQASKNLLTTAGISTLVELVDAGGATDSALISLNLGFNGIDSLVSVAPLVGIQNLTINDNLVSDLSPIAGLDALATLNIENIDPAAPDNAVASLAVLSNPGAADPLVVLYATANALANVDGLENKPNLTLAYLDGNQINNVFAFKGVGAAPSLSVLDLSDNLVQGFYFELEDLPAASSILLLNNPLLCGDIDNYFGAGAAGFGPAAIFEQASPTDINTVCSEDVDGDRFGAYRASVSGFAQEAFDQFPSDPAASVDTDGDGSPDEWNIGKSAVDSTSEPQLRLDDFPDDLAAAFDSEPDGCPDFWNAGKTAADSTTGLILDLVPDDFPFNDCVDADGDGIGPNQEAAVGTVDSDPDFDDDGLTDGEEVLEFLTDPTLSDTDDDGLTDGEEVAQYPTDPTNADSDGDRLLDGEEVLQYLTNPVSRDTDGDGFDDGDEIDFETDPLSSEDFPSAQGLSIPLIYGAIKRAAP
jgi:Leucine-rich repeat (LRR) protein